MPSLGADDELLIVDSGSSDDGVAYAASRGVRVERLPNVGYAAANNRGAALTTGRWLVFLNPDTVVEPGWLDALLAPLGDGPALATARVVLMDDPTRVDACGNLVHLSGITVCRGFGAPTAAFSRVEPLLAVSGAAFAVDRGTFERLGGMDERFFMYLEDTDFSLRAALAGVPCWLMPGAVVRHRHAPSFGPRKLFWLERNRYLMLLKVWSVRTLLALLPTLLLVEALVWGYALLRGPEALRAKVGAWGWLRSHPWAFAKARRRTQVLRAVDDRELLARCSWRLQLTELVPSPRLRLLAEGALLAPQAIAEAWRRLVLAA